MQGLIFVPVKTGLLLIVVCVSVVFGVSDDGHDGMLDGFVVCVCSFLVGCWLFCCVCFLVGMVCDGGTSMERLSMVVLSRVFLSLFLHAIGENIIMSEMDGSQ